MLKVAEIPIYTLYGEQDTWATPDVVHCESIAARSRLHDWHIKPHQHSGFLQILYLKSGSAVVHLDDQESVMNGGEVLLIPQNYIHGFEFSCEAIGYVLTVAYPFVLKLSREREVGMAALSHPLRYAPGDGEEGMQFNAIFEAFVREYRGVSNHRNLLVEALLTSIVALLSRQVQDSGASGPANSKDQLHFTKFIDLIEQWCDKHYPISHYAKEIGVTAAHLNSLCHRITQKSPLELVHERLLQEIKRSLIYTSLTISELSYAFGFSDPAYFTRFFRRETSESPKDFRKRAEQIRIRQTEAKNFVGSSSMPSRPNFWY